MSASVRKKIENCIKAYEYSLFEFTLPEIMGPEWTKISKPSVIGRKFREEVREGLWPRVRFVGRNSRNASVYRTF